MDVPCSPDDECASSASRSGLPFESAAGRIFGRTVIAACCLPCVARVWRVLRGICAVACSCSVATARSLTSRLFAAPTMDRVLRPTTAPPPRKAVSLKQVQHMVRQGKARGAAAPSNHDTNPHAHLREVDSLLNNGIVGEAPQQADPRSSSVFGSGRRHAYALETSHETPYGLDSDIKAQREAELEAYKQQAPHRVSTPFAVHEVRAHR